MKWLPFFLAAPAAFCAGLAAAPEPPSAPPEPVRPAAASSPRKVRVLSPEGAPLRARIEARTGTKLILAETDEQGSAFLPLDPGDVVVIEVVAQGRRPARRGPVVWDEAVRTFELR